MAKELVGPNLTSEMVPSTFALDSGEEIPWLVYLTFVQR